VRVLLHEDRGSASELQGEGAVAPCHGGQQVVRVEVEERAETASSLRVQLVLDSVRRKRKRRLDHDLDVVELQSGLVVHADVGEGTRADQDGRLGVWPNCAARSRRTVGVSDVGAVGHVRSLPARASENAGYWAAASATWPASEPTPKWPSEDPVSARTA